MIRVGKVAGRLGLALLASLVACAPPARTQEKALPPEAEKIGENRYRIGKVTVDLETKTLTCSGQINMRRGLIEYLAVAPGGKRHESALLLDLRPLHLQVGLILLGLEPRGGLRFQGDTQVPKGSPVEVYVSWERDGRRVRVHGEELAWHINQGRPMERKAWVFSGSAVRDGAFVADEELSLIATYRDPAAIINNALPTGSDDAVYKVNERIAPAVGTPVTVTVVPAPAAEAAPGAGS